jgi:dihydroxy-acid dehydratase
MKRERELEAYSLPFRHALMKGVGFTKRQLRKPLIGVLNSWGEINPAAGHLDRLTKMVKAGIESAGGTPMEFAISSLCGGMAGGGRGSSYSLAYRDVVADLVELFVEENFFDGIVFTSVCDDVVPAHLMAAARLNLPAILLLGGYMETKTYKGKARYVQQVGSGYGEVQKGSMSQEEFDDLAEMSCGNWGACPIMGTGNTMGAIAETLGMTLPGNATVSGADPLIGRLAYQAGEQIISLIKEGIKPTDILSMRSFENAIRVFLALGGSTNALIHLPAIAAEREIEIPLSLFDSLSRETPFLCNVKPSGKYLMKEFDEAGGLPALLKELSPLLHCETRTVTEKTLGENVKDSEVFNRNVIFPLSAPIDEEGGVAILRGSLAPEGAVVKVSGLSKEELTKKGPARVFESEGEACEHLLKGEIHPGDMVILRYVGPKGDPGMRISGARFLWLLSGMNLDTSVTLISDGRFSGTNKGGAVGHISPEAMTGGPIAVVQNGDRIEMDIRERRLDLVVPEEEIKRRLKSWRPPQRTFKKGLLARISKTMLPIEKGAILQRDF